MLCLLLCLDSRYVHVSTSSPFFSMHKFLFFVFAALLVLPQVAAGRWRAAAVRVPVDDDCTCNVVLSQESSWGLFQRPLFSVSGGQRRYLSRILRCFPDLAAPPPTFLSLWEPPLEVEQRRGLDRTSWRSPRTPTLPIGHLSGGGGGRINFFLKVWQSSHRT